MVEAWREPPRAFNLCAYVRSQEGTAECFAKRFPGMHALVEAHLEDQRDLEKLKHPERTLKSYVLQEAEAISRFEKLCWAAQVGREPVSLQHDGVLLRLWPHDNVVLVEQELSRLCSATLGYVQPVTHKAWD